MPTPSSIIESTVNEVPESRSKKNVISGRGYGLGGSTEGYGYRINSLLTPKVAPDYVALAREHTEMLENGKTSEEIAIWTGDKLNITAWKEGKFYGKRGALPTPETTEEMARFQKFVEAIGVTYAHEKGIEYPHANGPSGGQPQYFLLDGFVQNAWLGKDNMDKRTKKLTQMNHALNHIKDPQIRAAYILDKIGLDIQNDWSRLNIGYRSPLKSSSINKGISIGGSFYTKEDGTITQMVNILGITGTQSDFYENTAATGRLCFLR